jgi:SAM-dependent methyltransferase
VLGGLKRKAWKKLKYAIEGADQRLVDDWMAYLRPRLSALEQKMLTHAHDDHAVLPEQAKSELRADNARLRELSALYASLNLPVSVRTQWNQKRLDTQLDLLNFRGDNPYIWQYREWPRATVLKYYIYARYVQGLDSGGLLSKLGEDGAFGCWSFDYPGIGRVSRDLLDSVNELVFLDRHLGILRKDGLRVLDIGAGYGRLAYRMSQAAPGLADYCCVDAVPESSFLSEYYLRFRGCANTRVVTLDAVDRIPTAPAFDLATNIHSFSECTYAAVEWWVRQLQRLRVRNLLIVPNEPVGMLTTETDGSKRDFQALIEAAGYRLVLREPTFSDPAVRELLGIEDHFHLFELQT